MFKRQKTDRNTHIRQCKNVKISLFFFYRAASQDHLGAYNAHQNKPPGRITCLIVFNKHFESNENNWVNYFFFFKPLEDPGQKHWRLGLCSKLNISKHKVQKTNNATK